MDLSLSEPEQMLQEAVRAFVRREASREEIIKVTEEGVPWRPEWRRRMADAGWLGVFVPEELGGADGSTLQAVLIFEELGRGPVPGPWIASSLASACILRAAEPSERRDELLAHIATGTEVVVPAVREPGVSWHGMRSAAMEPTRDANTVRLSGTRVFVPWADAATTLLVSTVGDGDTVSLVAVRPDQPGVAIRRLAGFTTPLFEVTLTDVEMRPEDTVLRGDPREVDRSLAPALVATAAYQAGGAAALLDMSVQYANTRHQFGVPIGKFQRVQDHVIRILNAADVIRWMTYQAAWKLDTGQEALADAHMTAAVAAEQFFEAANAAHEVHAGIGTDPKFGLVAYTVASRSLYEHLGPPAWHRDRMAESTDWASPEVSS